MVEDICNSCEKSVRKIRSEEEVYNECRACNLGVFGNCSCEQYTRTLIKYYCDNCDYYVLHCEKCKKYYKNDICKQTNEYHCRNCLKQKYDRELLFYKNQYPNYKFEGDYDYLYQGCWILFKKQCIVCDNFTNNFSVNNINNKDFINIHCEKCDPSSEFKKYTYDKDTHLWKLKKNGEKCKRCNVTIWFDHYLRSSNTAKNIEKLMQCENCEPESNVIKYKYKIDGWYVSKIKVFNNNRHKWVNSTTSNGICQCNKCK